MACALALTIYRIVAGGFDSGFPAADCLVGLCPAVPFLYNFNFTLTFHMLHHLRPGLKPLARGAKKMVE